MNGLGCVGFVLAYLVTFFLLATDKQEGPGDGS